MSGVREEDVLRIQSSERKRIMDSVAIEQPISIIVENNEKERFSLGITMRTPGNDKDLVTGFLFSESIIKSCSDIESIFISDEEAIVKLNKNVYFDPDQHRRQSIKTSACGICGKEKISLSNHTHSIDLVKNCIESNTIIAASEILKSNQEIFDLTGGSHAAGLFSVQGELILIREDIGRHNAMDKLIGASICNINYEQLNGFVFLSGRASFELVQKAIIMGIPVLAAVGAPSSLAVDLARENNLTLIAFVKNERITVYSAPSRISNN
ncbi:MAG: formate dehydrogenase family accessory protein FdhD [Euryarchaeota archaeon]|nr:formate dehydrogenase family accessory protein FdhD [Euryarchaeota archaeon]